MLLPREVLLLTESLFNGFACLQANTQKKHYIIMVHVKQISEPVSKHQLLPHLFDEFVHALARGSESFHI